MTPSEAELYEKLKKKIPDDLTPDEYEKQIKKILDEVELKPSNTLK